MESPAPRLAIVALLVCAGCTSAHREPEQTAARPRPEDLTAVIPFDDPHVVFYWEGVRIHSPAHVTMVGETLLINGVGWKEPPVAFDTAAANVMFAKKYRGVPFIDSLVSAGKSYLEALNAYGLEMPRRFRRAFRQHRAEQRARGEPDSAISVAALAVLLDVPAQSVWITGRSVHCKFPGGLVATEWIDVPDSSLARDKFYSPPIAVDRGRHFRWMTERLRKLLDSSEPLLLIADRNGGGISSIRGDRAPEAQAALSHAIEVRDSTVDTRELAKAIGISSDQLATILFRRDENLTPH